MIMVAVTISDKNAEVGYYILGGIVLLFIIGFALLMNSLGRRY